MLSIRKAVIPHQVEYMLNLFELCFFESDFKNITRIKNKKKTLKQTFSVKKI